MPQLKLGTVTYTNNGIAKKIVVFNNWGNHLFATQTLNVYAQAAHLSILNPGDEVLFCHTEQGPYIVAQSSEQIDKADKNRDKLH